MFSRYVKFQISFHANREMYRSIGGNRYFEHLYAMCLKIGRFRRWLVFNDLNGGIKLSLLLERPVHGSPGWKEDSKSSISNVSSLGIKDQGYDAHVYPYLISLPTNPPPPSSSSSSFFVSLLLRTHPCSRNTVLHPSVSRGWRVSCARLISSIIAHPLYILYPFLKYHHDGSTSTFYRITGNRRYGVQLGEVKNEKPVIRDGISWEVVVRGNIKMLR